MTCHVEHSGLSVTFPDQEMSGTTAGANHSATGTAAQQCTCCLGVAGFTTGRGVVLKIRGVTDSVTPSHTHAHTEEAWNEEPDQLNQRDINDSE